MQAVQASTFQRVAENQRGSLAAAPRIEGWYVSWVKREVDAHFISPRIKTAGRHRTEPRSSQHGLA